jgi:hypothetical protein
MIYLIIYGNEDEKKGWAFFINFDEFRIKKNNSPVFGHKPMERGFP